MAHISKSAFVKGVQCTRQLYYYKNSYDRRDPLTATQRDKFKKGVDIGLLAQQLFPGGKDLSPQSPWQYKQASAVTRHFIEQGYPVLYEASFLANGLYAIVDIITIEGTRLKAYEVKNTRSVKDAHLLDASFQYYVMEQAGFSIDSIAIVYPNRSLDDYDPSSPLFDLFQIEDISLQVKDAQRGIAYKAAMFIDTIGQPEPPHTKVGSHCFSPYACDFMHLCWANMPKQDIVDLLASNTHWHEVAAEKNLTPALPPPSSGD